MVSSSNLTGAGFESILSSLPSLGSAVFGEIFRKKQEERKGRKNYAEGRASIDSDTQELIRTIMASQGAGVQDETSVTRARMAGDKAQADWARRNMSFGGKYTIQDMIKKGKV